MRSFALSKWAAMVGLIALLTSGCGWLSGEDASSKIDPPQFTEEEVSVDELENTAGDDVSNETATMKQTLYLEDAHGYVVPVTMTLPKEEGVAQQVLKYMVKGGPVEAMLPEGFSAILPEGTKILGMKIKEGVATVDFSNEFTKYDKNDERKILDAITRALTEFDNIKKVTIWVNGYPLNEMPVSQTPTNLLTREGGINLELAANAVPGHTSAVTVFFQGQWDNENTYFVPVTRLIPRTDQLARAVVEEFIKGPKDNSPLVNAIIPTTKVLDVKQQGDLVTVNLSEDVLNFDSGREANPLAMEALVLSLTETTGAKQVQIFVEGKPMASSGKRDFSKPVMRPEQINPLPS